MEEHAGGVDDVEAPIERIREVGIEECLQGLDPPLVGQRGRPAGRLHAENVEPQRLVVSELRAVVRADVEHALARRGAKKAVRHLTRDRLEVPRQGCRDPRQIGMVAEHDFLGDRVIELRGGTPLAEDHSQRIVRLRPHFLLAQEMIAPRLPAEIDGRRKVGAVTHAAARQRHANTICAPGSPSRTGKV